MRETLQKLDHFLETRRPRLYQALRPGLDHQQLSELRQGFGFSIHTPLRLWWQWRDGQVVRVGSGTLFFNRTLMTAAESVQAAKLLQSMFADSPSWWGPRWVPILTNGAGDYICVDLKGDQSLGYKQHSKRGQIVEHWHDDKNRSVLAPDLASWLEAMIDSWQRCNWRETEGGSFTLETEEDWRAHKAVMHENIHGYPRHFTGHRT
ncbi:MAG: SMI1/KNR4 family protein [Myxococcota bacterium]